MRPVLDACDAMRPGGRTATRGVTGPLLGRLIPLVSTDPLAADWEDDMRNDVRIGVLDNYAGDVHDIGHCVHRFCDIYATASGDDSCTNASRTGGASWSWWLGITELFGHLTLPDRGVGPFPLTRTKQWSH